MGRGLGGAASPRGRSFEARRPAQERRRRAPQDDVTFPNSTTRRHPEEPGEARRAKPGVSKDGPRAWRCRQPSQPILRGTPAGAKAPPARTSG
ncbi:hypothetical protein RPC_4116 [Rhodopseudomonas palustris BisB18]|uniref:Uncharacterized protein n=1 Tax=Rhodopseudomonas palustris (strain BisB18) TaxID=316056 RepID=Q20YZ4_RHOPB